MLLPSRRLVTGRSGGYFFVVNFQHFLFLFQNLFTQAQVCPGKYILAPYTLRIHILSVLFDLKLDFICYILTFRQRYDIRFVLNSLTNEL